MKKLLILMLVLGMASMTNAYTISIGWVDGFNTSTKTYTSFNTTDKVVAVSDVVYIGLYNDTAGSAEMHFYAIDDAVGHAITRGSLFDRGIAGNSSSHTYQYSYGGQEWWTAESKTGDPDSFPIQAGLLFVNEITVDSIDQDINVDLWDETGYTYISGFDLIPEPMTVVLLGLGGLFLRRRK